MTDNDGLTKIASGLKVNNTKLINLTTIVAYLCADIRCCMLVDSMLSLMRLSWAYNGADCMWLVLIPGLVWQGHQINLVSWKTREPKYLSINQWDIGCMVQITPEINPYMTLRQLAMLIISLGYIDWKNNSRMREQEHSQQGELCMRKRF